MALPDNLRFFPGVTDKDYDADLILEGAKGETKWVIIIGETEGGDEFFSSSKSDGPEIVWALERAKLKLLRMIDGED